MIVFSAIKRCQHPRFTQLFQKQKKAAARVLGSSRYAQLQIQPGTGELLALRPGEKARRAARSAAAAYRLPCLQAERAALQKKLANAAESFARVEATLGWISARISS